MFYTFDQNNSGGSFVFDESQGISVNVIVEADSAEEANSLAQEIGLYFDGCADGHDCNCCGDRWYPQWSDDRGSEVPSIYDVPIPEYTPTIRWVAEGNPDVFVHHKDGTVTGHVLD